MGLIRERIREKADEIEQELRAIGWWDIPEPEPAAFTSDVAFFMDTMAFPQWIRFVLLPTVHRILEADEDLPLSSSVGTQAIREFDGDERAERLTHLLSQFDGLIRDARDELAGEPA